MPHYMIGMMKVTDRAVMEARMAEFVATARASVAQYGGRFGSPEYTEARRLREQFGTASHVLMQSIDH